MSDDFPELIEGAVIIDLSEVFPEFTYGLMNMEMFDGFRELIEDLVIIDLSDVFPELKKPVG